ncbi:hypothetical protein AbauAttikon1_0003 [Acinetobacter phage Abau_Attikon1]
MDNEYAKFFFNRKVDVYQLECIMNFCQHLFKDPECWVIWTRH